ncbi:MAG TPA: hypothetical protein VGJ53_04015 [Micromonosporaceae bacterium]
MAIVETAHDVLVALTGRYAFSEVAALVGAGADGLALTTQAAAEVQHLCAFGQRLLDLDAEDFGLADATVDANTDTTIADGVGGDAVPAHLRLRALACRMPQAADERHRGALGTLRPAYRLLLEVIDAHWRRRETAALVATIHIASEYAPMLVWERILGHAGDPALLPTAVAGEGSAWGDFQYRDCPHTKAERSAAKRVLRVAQDQQVGWQSYLDRQHSTTARALAVCAAECGRPCTVVTRLSKEDVSTVAEGCRLALAFVDSPIVRLRHSAPVGHGFGVPSPDEVRLAWDRSRRSLSRSGVDLPDDGFALPGLPSLFGAFAGVPMPPDTLVADTAAAVRATLTA